MSNSIRCCECGRFCIPHDRGVYWGSTFDLDPPEDSFFCKSCVEKLLKRPKNVILGCWWIKPRFVSKIERMKTFHEISKLP